MSVDHDLIYWDDFTVLHYYFLNKIKADCCKVIPYCLDVYTEDNSIGFKISHGTVSLLKTFLQEE